MTQHQHHSDKEPWKNLPEGFADYLELEARLNGPVRNTALEAAADAVDTPPFRIVDLGSGTGADAIALAERFPAARVHALDISAELLERVGSAAEQAQVGDRLEKHQADLNGDWSSVIPAEVDLVWAALSMHHLADPAAALRQVFSSLRPGGVFVLIEMSGEARFEPGDLHSGSAALREKIMAAPSHGHHGHTDWPALLTAAGFTVVEQREREFSLTSGSSDGRRYLERQLRSRRERLNGRISDDDLEGLDAVIDALESGGPEISLHSGRMIRVARRPQE